MALIENLPEFVINDISDTETGRVINGIFDHLSGVDKGFAYLYAKNKPFFHGKIIQLDEAQRLASFLTNDLSDHDMLQIGDALTYFDGYWGERAQLALDDSLAWSRLQHKASDSIRYHTDGTQEVITDGWDHDHCAICFQAIGAGNQPYGYRDQKEHWACEHCYQEYILKRSPAFIHAG